MIVQGEYAPPRCQSSPLDGTGREPNGLEEKLESDEGICIELFKIPSLRIVMNLGCRMPLRVHLVCFCSVGGPFPALRVELHFISLQYVSSLLLGLCLLYDCGQITEPIY